MGKGGYITWIKATRFSFWKYGISATLFGRWFYFGYNPSNMILFSERYGYTKVYRFHGFIFKTKQV